MSDEPESAILRYLRDIRADIGDVRSEVKNVRSEMATKSDLNSLRADIASDIAMLQAEDQKTRKELGDQMATMRGQLFEYHSSVIGHGILISELDARMRRVEQHLNLPSIDPH